MDTTTIQLIDNTAPAERPAPEDASFSRTSTAASSSPGSRLWNRPSIRAERAKRRYAKWQPERLGVSTAGGDIAESDPASSSDEGQGQGQGGLVRAGTITNTLTNTSTIQEGVSTADGREGSRSDSQAPLFEQASESDGIGAGQQVQQQDFGAGASDSDRTEQRATTGAGITHQSKNHPKICGLKPGSELDILYENQRGWFFFGIPLYSNQSLLNIDPAPWINARGKRSFVNITNAQVPDPSWEWAWKTWYVDMSGDVDDQGWQYAFAFSSSPSSWHGTHPFWHSFVRQRRWVRLRVKRTSERERYRRSRTGFELAHSLNEDYFTIHSALRRKRASGSETASKATSFNMKRTITETQDEGVEDIKNVPALIYAIKAAIVDREKLDAVRKFIEDGGEELYYLDSKVRSLKLRASSLVLTH